MSETDTAQTEKPIFFIHVPKTGGNTVVAWFLAFMPVDRVYPPPPRLTLPDADLEQARALLPGLTFLHGHTEGGLSKVLPLDDLQLVTFLRHPVRLVVSHYLHFRYAPSQVMHRAARTFGIQDFLRRFPTFGTNPQARYLSRSLGLNMPVQPGETIDLIGRGMAALDRMAFVGLTERMNESLDAMGEMFGFPSFPVGRHNEGRASRDEVEACEAVVRRDEFVMRLGVDLALRFEAERRFERLLEQTRLATLRARLVAGLRGRGRMPHVAARTEGAAVVFLDGWHPQGWIGAPVPQTAHWWGRDRPRLLVANVTAQPLTLSFRVAHTTGFPAAQVRLTISGRVLTPEVTEGPEGTVLTWRIDPPVFRRSAGAVEALFVGLQARSFADLDAASEDFESRSFALSDLRVAVEQ